MQKLLDGAENKINLLNEKLKELERVVNEAGLELPKELKIQVKVKEVQIKEEKKKETEKSEEEEEKSFLSSIEFE